MLLNKITGVYNKGTETSNASNKTTIEIPVILDGRQIAYATAPYMDNQLNNISTREGREVNVRSTDRR